jgi:hypothetical protein
MPFDVEELGFELLGRGGVLDDEAVVLGRVRVKVPGADVERRIVFGAVGAGHQGEPAEDAEYRQIRES